MAGEAENAEGQAAENKEGGQTVDNLKAEMNRKFQNLTEANEGIKQQNTQLTDGMNNILQQLKEGTEQKQANTQQETMDELKWSDPDKYAEIKVNQAKAGIDKQIDDKVTSVTQAQSERTQILGQLTVDYPELNDQSSDLYKKALEIHNTADPKFRDTANGYRYIVREAAAQIGVLPLNKRVKADTDADEFVVTTGETMSDQDRENKNAAKKLDPRTLAFAERVKLDINDPKVIERLKQRSERDFKRWR